ncbi:MAG TPA: hypothetical protein VF723_07630 [Pyrinomonadaceae bacterium]|jgi:hypothetical protein
MQENETAPDAVSAPEESGGEQTSAAAAEPTATAAPAASETPAEPEAPAVTEEITYHAVEKDGQVTAIWEMQGRKHLRTIDPRSRQGQDILRLYTSDHPDEAAAQPEGAAGASGT